MRKIPFFLPARVKQKKKHTLLNPQLRGKEKRKKKWLKKLDKCLGS